MTHHEAITLIDNPYLRQIIRPTRWADLGCGSGTFTLALADLLVPGSSIEAVDLQPAIAAQTTARGVTIHPRAVDFTTLAFTSPGSTTSEMSDLTMTAATPDRLWPGPQPPLCRTRHPGIVVFF
jgi:hypothetical protein